MKSNYPDTEATTNSSKVALHTQTPPNIAVSERFAASCVAGSPSVRSCGAGSRSARGKPITCTSDRRQELAAVGHVDLLPNLTHVDLDDILVALEVLSPHVAEDLRLGKNTPSLHMK